jgi:hypothetical protein
MFRVELPSLDLKNLVRSESTHMQLHLPEYVD